MALKYQNFKIIVHNTQINIYMLLFWVENCPKFEDENLSGKSPAEMEFCKIDP
jgi:hypothetical protein